MGITREMTTEIAVIPLGPRAPKFSSPLGPWVPPLCRTLATAWCVPAGTFSPERGEIQPLQPPYGYTYVYLNVYINIYIHTYF